MFERIKVNKLQKSMFLNTMCKPLGMLISFIYTPLLLDYLGEESYGVWSTILSVINWINYFDVGIGQGMRNKLTQDISNDDEIAAKKTVSTGYVSVTLIATVLFVVGLCFILFVDVGDIFNTRIPVRTVLNISFSCVCVNFVLSLSKILLYSTHQAEKVGIMILLIQVMNLLGVFILSFFSKGSLLGVAIVVGLSGIIINLIFSFNLWKKKQFLIPNLKLFDSKDFHNISGTGIKFFFIQIAGLVLYSSDNMIITQLFGPSCVTSYHTVHTVFNVLNGLFVALMAPLWAQYTVKLNQKDYLWIRNTIIKLDKTLPLIAMVLIFGVILFKPVAKIWLQKDLVYEDGLVVCMAVYIFVNIWASIYATALNGMNKVNLQLILSCFVAILNIPLSIFLGRNCGLGTTGVCLATVVCMLISTIPIVFSTHKTINQLQIKNYKSLKKGLL